MSSLKCSSCGLVNFATSQFCKRCNLDLAQVPVQNGANETRIVSNSYNTSARPTVPLQNSFQAEPFQQAPKPRQYQPQLSYQQQRQEQNAWSLPQFPSGERPPTYNQQSYQRPYQPLNNYSIHEPTLRRFGDEISLHSSANLPCYCVKCGKHLASPLDGEYIAQKFRWHNPLVYIALISPIIYIILALCLSKRMTVNVPLCTDHLKSREDTKHLLLGGGLVSFILIILCGIFDAGGLSFLVFLIAIFAIPIIHEYSYKPLRASNIEGNHCQLTGASKEFLSKIPY
jgi:hypothetical protein